MIFPDPQTLLLFDIPLFLLFFGVIFLIVKFFFVSGQDPVANTAIAAVAGGAAFIIVRSQSEIQRWIWFNMPIVWILVVLIFILIVVRWILKF